MLADLPHLYRVAFCCSCCQRLIPSYVKFEQAEAWGDSALLHRALDRLWLHCQGETLGDDEALAFEMSCERAAPDTEKFSSIYASAALDAAAAIVETVGLCRSRDVRHALAVSTAATDAVAMFLQINRRIDPNATVPEDLVAAHPLMRQEIDKQASDARALMALRSLARADVEQLKQSSSYDLLDLSLRPPWNNDKPA